MGTVWKDSRRGLPRLQTAWIITAAAAVLLMLVSITTYTFGVFFKPISGEFGWSRSAVSGALAMRFIVMAIVVAPMGYWSDRYGPRKLVLTCFVFVGISFLLLAKVTALWHLYVVQGLLMGIGTAGPLACVMATVGKWHDKGRGLALSVASAGAGISSVIFPPVATGLIQTIGWQAATAILGVLVLAAGIPISMLVRDPAPITREGGRPTSEVAQPANSFHAWKMAHLYLSNPTFVAIFIMFFLSHTAVQMVIGHFVNFATDAGISAILAASMMSALGLANLAGRLGIGSLSDRLGVRKDLLVCFGAISVSLILLTSSTSESVLWIAVIIFGLGLGGLIPLIPALVGETFGTVNLAALTGMIFTGTFLGGAFGPWMGGFLFDVSKSYTWAFGVAAAFTTVSLLLALRLHRARKKDSLAGM